MPRQRQLALVSCLAFGAFGLAGAAAFSESLENLIRRYPYDPACLWGRVANGKGTIVRCLSEQEATQLSTTVNALPALPTTTTVPAPATPQGTTAGSAAAGVTQAPESAPKPGRFEVTVGPVSADSGELPLGKLGQPKDRYAKCLEDHGGLKGESGEVHVRFLVRAKGIAEGVSVQKRVNVSAETARCVSEVVDRRHVGVPSEPLVGATLVVKFANRP
jgi:hypothetical protein